MDFDKRILDGLDVKENEILLKEIYSSQSSSRQ